MATPAPSRSRLVILAAAAAGFVLSTFSEAADDGCARVLKALENVVTTPAHVYMQETSSRRGASETETIYADGKVYVRVQGRWMLNPITAAEMADQQRKNRKHASMTCKAVGEEKVEDRIATVYTSRRRTTDGQVDARLWVDKVSGLLLKQEEDLTAGPDNTVHRTSRFEYGNVRAPEIATQ